MSDPEYVGDHRVEEDPSPPDDPAGSILAELRRKYLPPGFIESLIRVWVTTAIGAGLAWAAAHWNILVPADASSTVSVVATGLCIAGYYALCRLVEKRWPKAGAFLISFGLIQAKPVYAQPTEATRLTDTRTSAVRRFAPITSTTPDPPTTPAGSPP